MTMAAYTGKTESRVCLKCGVRVPHREAALVGCPQERHWRAVQHAAPCGQSCFGAGATSATRPWEQMHGWGDRCPVCGPLRMLPEVADEMRRLAEREIRLAAAASPEPWWQGGTDAHPEGDRDLVYTSLSYGGATWVIEPSLREEDAAFIGENRQLAPALAVAVLRCLDEIDKLTRERGELQKALDAAREEVTQLQMRLDDIAVSQADAAIAQEQAAARARCAAEGHTPEWVSCDPYSADKDYRCTLCGDHLPEPEDGE